MGARTMPPTGHVFNETSSSADPSSRPRYQLPAGYYLLVTTRTHVFVWDSKGTQVVFRSSKKGIAAAKAAKDGSGILAVADKHVVVLHDTKRGQEKSWGLTGDEDEVRQLEYTADAKSLFLCTKLTPEIQCYSTELSRLLSPCRIHATAPAALAVSSTGHLLVSASESPPVVYLKNLTLNTPPVPITTVASDAAVSVVAFHPERPNVFLLAFMDGTIAAYDASKIERVGAMGTYANQESVNSSEVGRMTGVHRTTTRNGGSSCIAGAAFMPGYKTRAISVGSDGRCRILDFAQGGQTIRTWHAKAPVTSAAVISISSKSEGHTRTKTRSQPHLLRGPTSTNDVIAIGREDGRVQIYDSLGLMLCQKSFSPNDEKVISLEWIKGLPPKPLDYSVATRDESDGPSLRSMKPGARLNWSPSAANTIPEAMNGFSKPSRKFTIHPDEVEENTVRHNPSSGTPGLVPVENQYLDLFSPVKSQEQKMENASGGKVASPVRSRARISSQTFVRSPEPTPAANEGSMMSKARNLALFPSTDSGSPQTSAQSHGLVRPNQPSASPAPPKKQSRRMSLKISSLRGRRRSSPSKLRTIASHNATVLANLRKMSNIHPAQRPEGLLSTYARSRPDSTTRFQIKTCERSGPHYLHRSVDHVEIAGKSDHHARRAYEEAHERAKWPEDSHQGSSLEGDIWLTSDSEDTMRLSRRRQRLLDQRPPARQTTRTKVQNNETLSTTVCVSVDPPTVHPRLTMDGSTEEGAIVAPTHVSVHGNFTPSSNDVRGLFPRNSSLSPRTRRSVKGHRSQRHLQDQPCTLQDLAPNTLYAREVRSPSTRARAIGIANAIADKGSDRTSAFTASKTDRTRPTSFVHGDAATSPHGKTSLPTDTVCGSCLHTTTQMQSVETEIMRLKGEVLALKAVLRRNGISIPTGGGAAGRSQKRVGWM